MDLKESITTIDSADKVRKVTDEYDCVEPPNENQRNIVLREDANEINSQCCQLQCEQVDTNKTIPKEPEMSQIKQVAPLARVSPSPAPIPVQEVQPMGASALPLNSTPPNGATSSRRRLSNGDSNIRSTPGRGNDAVDYASDLLQSPGEIRSPSRYFENLFMFYI